MSAPQETDFVTTEQVEAAVQVIQEWDNGSLICINEVLDGLNDPLLANTPAVNRVMDLVFELLQDDRVRLVEVQGMGLTFASEADR
jgi:hypothetical protein